MDSNIWMKYLNKWKALGCGENAHIYFVRKKKESHLETLK